MAILAAQVPDPPMGLVHLPTITNASQIGLSWLAPDDGGSPIIEYKVWYGQGDDFTVLEESVEALTYTAKPLTQGETYKFKL